jgi:hypothetical protein
VLLVESDDSNPDVYKALSDTVQCEICNLDLQEGYIKLGELIEANQKSNIVVNTAARATNGIVEHVGIIKDTCTATGHELVLVWPINRQRDSLELLRDVMQVRDAFKAAYVVLNTYFGKAEKFTRYNNSKMKQSVTGTIELPELDDDTTDILIDNRLHLGNAAEKLTIAKRSALHKYRTQVHDAFNEVIK